MSFVKSFLTKRKNALQTLTASELVLNHNCREIDFRGVTCKVVSKDESLKDVIVELRHDDFSISVVFDQNDKFVLYRGIWTWVCAGHPRVSLEMRWPHRRGNLLKVFGSVGVLTNPEIGWPSSGIGYIDPGELVVFIDDKSTNLGTFCQVVTRFGVGFVLKSLLGPA